MYKYIAIATTALTLFISPTLFSSSNEETKSKGVETCIEKYPELHWLADSKVRKTEEGAGTGGGYSQKLFGQAYPEFDRSYLSLQCLEWIVDGTDNAYQSFTASQPDPVRLTRAHFQELHQRALSILNNTFGLTFEETYVALQAALVLGDMGKSPTAREIFKPFGATAPDQDDFYGEAMSILKNNPNLSPTFARLSPAAKDLLIATAHMAHYGHITHLEGGPAMFSGIKERNVEPFVLEFDLFVHLCDVAGAFGHVKPGSSFAYNDQTHQAKNAMRRACQALLTTEFTELDAYNQYVAERASWLGFDASKPLDRALARIGAMIRLFTPQEGTILRDAMTSLSPQERSRISAELDVQKFNPHERTPTYMPAVLVNLHNNPSLGDTPEKRLRQAIALGLPFISRVLETYRSNLKAGTIRSDIPLNFNPVAGVAKAAPNDLKKGTFFIDNEGNVKIK